MKLVYPACFYPCEEKKGGYTVEVPDLPGCVSDGDNLADAIRMGIDAASGWILDELESGKIPPAASHVESITPKTGGFVNLLVLDMDAYAKKYGGKVSSDKMSLWTIKFHEKAREEVDALPVSLEAKLRLLLENIKAGGFENLPPKSVKNIGGGIRELRVKSDDGIARSLYVTETGRMVYVLVAFVKKTDETPPRYIDLAQKRRSEI